MGEFVIVRKGSAPAEHLLVADLYLLSALKKRATAVRISGPILSMFANAGFTDIVPVRIGHPGAVARLLNVTLKAGAKERVIAFGELFGDRSAERWTELAAVARAKDEAFLAWFDVVEAQRAEQLLSDFLRTGKDHLVILLGDYSPEGRARLQAIRSVLEPQYRVHLVDEVEEPTVLTPTDKVAILTGAARFVVADDSSAAGHLAELAPVAQRGTPMIVLRLEGSYSSAMTRGLSIMNEKVEELTYTAESLERILSDAVVRTEERIAVAESKAAEVWPWKAANAD